MYCLLEGIPIEKIIPNVHFPILLPEIYNWNWKRHNNLSFAVILICSIDLKNIKIIEHVYISLIYVKGVSSFLKLGGMQ